LLVELPASEAGYREAIAGASRDGANAMMVLDSPDVLTNRALIAALIEEAKIPAIYPFSESLDAGGLIAYSKDRI
jgi:putative tryptophan/tyrosine transport system substrate-binding protein